MGGISYRAPCQYRDEREIERETGRESGGGVVREREWVRVGSRRNHARNGYGQQVERRKTNWRDASDIHSFFFTRFPEEMNESDLWYELTKYGFV